MRKILLAGLLLASSSSFAQMWEPVAAMPEGKHHPVTFALDGKGYAITGTRFVFAPTSDVYQYDPVTDEWSELASFPGAARSFAIGQAYNGKGYLGFGATSSAYLRDIWEYDPQANSWRFVTNCDCEGRRHPAFIIRDDKIYVGLGDGPSGNLNDWHVYDMVTDTWTAQTNLPGLVRHHPFQFYAGDDVYTGLGHGNSVNGNLVIFKDWYRFDVATNTWETMSDFPGEARVAGTQFAWQGKGYVLSGDGDNHSFMPEGEFWEYDSDMDSWTELTPHPGISRWAPGSFVIDGTVYFLGGENRQTGTILSDMWKYQLTEPTPVDTTPTDTTPVDTVINSIGNLLGANEIVVYPNPANDVLNFRSEETVQEVSIYTLQGKVALEIVNPGNSVDVSELNSGIYLIEGKTEFGRLFRQRLMIQ